MVRKACRPQPLQDQRLVMTAAWARVSLVRGAVWPQAAVVLLVVAEPLGQAAVALLAAAEPLEQAAVAQLVAAEPLGQAVVVQIVAEQAAVFVAQVVAAEQVVAQIVAAERLTVAVAVATADTVVAVVVGRAIAGRVDSRLVAADNRSSASADHSPAAGRAVAAAHSRQTDSTADQELACFSCPDCRGCRPRRAVWNGSYSCLCLAMIQNADGHPRRSCFLWSSFWRNSRPDVHR